MNIHKKLAFTALSLAVTSGASAAAYNSPPGSPNRMVSHDLPQFEEATVHSIPSSSSSSSDGQVAHTSAPLYPLIDNNPHLWDAQKPSNLPVTDDASAPFLPHAPETPRYEFLKGAAFQGFCSSAGKGLFIGGLAGLGGYALSRSGVHTRSSLSQEELKMLACIASGSAAIGAGLIAASAHDTLNTIERTRGNIATNPQAFNAQISAHLQPTLNARIAQIQRTFDANKSSLEEQRCNVRGRILQINTDHDLTQTLPATIEELSKTARQQRQTVINALDAYNRIRQSGILITQTDTNVAAARFDAQINTAREAHNRYIRTKKPEEPNRTFADFLPNEIKRKCPLSSSFASSQNGFDQLLGEIGFIASREEVINDDALLVARDRHNREVSDAKSMHTIALQTLHNTQNTIESKETQLARLLQEGYGDRKHCDGRISNLELQIEGITEELTQACNALEKQKTDAGTATPQDISGASAHLQENCNSANESWYQGAFAGGLTTAFTAVATLCYYWFN